MKIKITSDGTSNGTWVCNAETGERIHGVKSVTWEVGAGGKATVALVIGDVALECVGELHNLEKLPHDPDRPIDREMIAEARAILEREGGKPFIQPVCTCGNIPHGRGCALVLAGVVYGEIESPVALCPVCVAYPCAPECPGIRNAS